MEELVKLSKILSDINRIKIISLLFKYKELCVCEICDSLELSQPLVSRHLKQMREGSILDTKKEGKWIIYSLNQEQSTFFQCFLQELKNSDFKIAKLIKCKTF